MAETQGGKLRVGTTEELSILAGSIDNASSDFFFRIIHVYLSYNDSIHSVSLLTSIVIKKISHVIWQKANLTETNLLVSCSLP